MTIAVERRPFYLWWMPIPPAAITFHGEAHLREGGEVPSEVREKLVSKLEMSAEEKDGAVFIEMTPRGHFSTYGVGVSLGTMLRPAEAWGRVEV